MTRRTRKIGVRSSRRLPVAVTQCERCMDIHCRQQVDCAKREFEAIRQGTMYECSDYQPPYSERLCA